MAEKFVKARNPTVDPRAVMRLYEGELHAIGEMLTVVGVPENDDEGYPISDRLRVRVLIDQHLETQAEVTRLQVRLEYLESRFLPGTPPVE